MLLRHTPGTLDTPGALDTPGTLGTPGTHGTPEFLDTPGLSYFYLEFKCLNESKVYGRGLDGLQYPCGTDGSCIRYNPSFSSYNAKLVLYKLSRGLY